MEPWNDGISFLHLQLTRRRSGRDLWTFVMSWRTRRTEASPPFQRHCGDGHQSELADHVSDQPWKCFLHEAVGMETDAEHVNAEPREAGNDIAEDRHERQTAFPNEPTPARVQNDRIPQNNQERSVFFRIPAPEAAPGLICPYPPENCRNQAE